VAEVWRFQEETGADIKEIDKAVAESKAAPMGPFFLADLLGLDTVVHVAEHLRDSYGDRFFVHKQMQELAAEGNLGAKTGKGFYEHGS
jgi:3-hydroxyacyl-CoA dehydrogenase